METREKQEYCLIQGRTFLLSAFNLSRNFEQKQKLKVHYFIQRAFYLNEVEELEENIEQVDPVFAFLYFQGIELFFKAIVYWECSALEASDQQVFLKRVENTHDLISIFNLIQELKKVPEVSALWKKKIDDEEIENCLYLILGRNCKLCEVAQFRKINELGRYGFAKREDIKIEFSDEMKLEELQEGLDGWRDSIAFAVTFFEFFKKQILNS